MHHLSTIATTLIFAAQMMTTTTNHQDLTDQGSEPPAERLLQHRPAEHFQVKTTPSEYWGLPYKARTVEPFDALKHQYRLPSVLEPRLPQCTGEMTV